jgi:lysophospholipase L1-like esterase
VPPPSGYELALGVGLPIGQNRPNTYMAFGDSITQGDGSRGRRGYRDELQAALVARFGRAQVLDEGVSGTDSDRGLGRLPDSLERRRPAFALIHYGTNDWNGFGCRTVCGTTENLRRMVQTCRAARTLPVVATLIPANPAYEARLASARNDWIVATNAQIRAMAAAEGVALADLHAAFVREDPAFEPLFSDHVHPNDRGYAVMAAEFYRVLTAPRGP